MSLIKCPECGNECSNQAESFPKCGFPFFSKSNSGDYITQKVMLHFPLRGTTDLESKLSKYLADGWEIVSYERDNLNHMMHVDKECIVTLRKKESNSLK